MDAVLIGLLCLVCGALGSYLITAKRASEALKAKDIDLADQGKLLALNQAESNSTKKLFDSRSEELKEAFSELLRTKEQVAALEAVNGQSDLRLSEFKEKIEEITHERNNLIQKISALKEQEPIRIGEHERRVEQLNATFSNLERERQRDRDEKQKESDRRLLELKDTWSKHERSVEEKVKLVCQKFGIEYVDKEKFPLKGKPDNTVRICDEYIIFDAKSPQGEDLSNFPAYVRSEAEKLGKYLNHEEVKKDGFFVVPTASVEAFEDTLIELGTSRVHVITIDSLVPVLLQLKKIESYEFAEKLDPEDREKIVSLIGRMAHSMKRRAQVDHFFINDTISILLDAESLPEDILDAAQKVEKNSKLNPPQERRAKQIETSSLIKAVEKVVGRVQGQGIHVGNELEQAIKTVPLHKN